MAPPRVLIIDDHPLVCEALEIAVRGSLPGVAVDIATTMAGAEDCLRRRRDYRLILLDLMMPDVHGFSGFLNVQDLARTAPIVIISGRSDPGAVSMARSLGAAGFIAKSEGLAQIGEAIAAAAEGQTIFPAISETEPDVASTVEAIASFSPAQRRIMFAVCDGRSNKQIAYDLGLSEATVKVHVSAGLRKLGVPNRARAILLMQPVAEVAAPSR